MSVIGMVAIPIGLAFGVADMNKLVAAFCLATLLAGCDESASKLASYNLSQAADNFEIGRRIVFYNGFTGDYILSLEGRCSLEVDKTDAQLEVTCKTGPDQFKKHYLGLADNVTYFAEQLEGAYANTYHYRVIFRPQTILPDLELDVSQDSLREATIAPRRSE